jgi:hypothetical protein
MNNQYNQYNPLKKILNIKRFEKKDKQITDDRKFCVINYYMIYIIYMINIYLYFFLNN